MEEDDWDEFYRMAREIFYRLLNEFLRDFNEIFGDSMENPGSSRLYGFKIEIGPDGIPKIYRLGNEDSEHKEPRIVVVSDEPDAAEPLTDVYDEDNSIRVVVELPGVSEQDIAVTPIDDKHILLEALGSYKRYRKMIELPTEIDAESIRYSYRNGLLEIVASKKQNQEKLVRGGDGSQNF